MSAADGNFISFHLLKLRLLSGLRSLYSMGPPPPMPGPPPGPQLPPLPGSATYNLISPPPPEVAASFTAW